MNRHVRKKKRPEFSKVIVAVVMVTYFVGVYIGARVVMAAAPDQLGSYLAFIGTPTATTIGFYCWKAKNENIHKNPDVVTASEENTENLGQGEQSMKYDEYLQ
ncbi:MAG TPA: hypothetical protein DIT32_03420 [Peptococcaceae bacterium]|nr:hypothetical protein [Peptococcaceae bacterium]